MWIFYAIGSSFFAGITAILAKCGIKKTDSNVATAIRTVVVLLFSWLMVLITGTWGGIRQIDGRTLLFLILSGLATGASPNRWYSSGRWPSRYVWSHCCRSEHLWRMPSMCQNPRRCARDRIFGW